MRRNGFGAGSFLLGILVGLVLLILIAFAVSTNSTVQFNEPNHPTQASNQPTTPSGQLQREKGGSSDGTVTFNARVEWDQFMSELAAIPRAIVNWVKSVVHIEIKPPTIDINPATP